MNDKVSIVIPSRNEIFLQKTIQDLLKNARGDIEIIAILDGYYPPADEIVQDKRVHYLHRGEPRGMRNGITSAVNMATGKYIMKIDGHCMVDEGFDVKLKADCEENWVSIPRRKRLDAENWCIQDVGKPDVDYNYLSFPDNPSDFGGPGLNGRIWTEKALERTDPKYDIDDEMSFQGSCWFMHKTHFHNMELMDEENYGTFWNEAQEIGLKTWLSGGRVVRNKKTWYAHLHKGRKYGRGYFIHKRTIEQGAMFGNKWLDNKAWDKQTLPFSFLIEKFWPVPGWPDNWKEVLAEVGLRSDTMGERNNTNKALSPLETILNIPGITTDKKPPYQIPNFTRNDLAELFATLGYESGAEIGVEQGAYSKVLLDSNPKLVLLGVDPLIPYEGYREHVSKEKMDGFFEKVRKELPTDRFYFDRRFSLEAVKDVQDESLDFVYIDANHDFQNTTNDIAEWSKKVKKGGIVAGHDFTRNKKKDYKCHVKDVVHGWTYAHDIKNWFITSDRSPSWFYVKE